MIPIRDDNPTHRPAAVTTALVIACVLVFLVQIGSGPGDLERSIYSFGMIPAVLLGYGQLSPDLVAVGPEATLFTSMFLHGGWGHLLGNMLYLWIFGNNVEDRMGHLPFLVFYLACGLAAAAAQILPDPRSEIPMVGASGAISGVLGAYMVLFPHARVLVLIPFSFMLLHYVRAFWLLAIWIGLQLFSATLYSAAEGGVAWWAHIGGFALGWLVAWPLRAVQGVYRRGPWG
jgi:membrane associated rhomboid family serine protease